jgi:hypothetical protein
MPDRRPMGVGDRFAIDIDDVRVLSGLSRSEVAEQLRDWAVMGTLVRMGGAPAKLAGLLYGLPPARLPYLDELYAFEYGPARRAYIGDRVLVFHDADDPAPLITLARIADRVRRETGAIPKSVESYVTHADRENATIVVTRDSDVAGADLFSNAYGYVETTVADPETLSKWLSQVDDLVYANLQEKQITLGGRRFERDRGKNIDLEDVAVLYTAQRDRLAERALVQARGYGQALDSLGFSLDPTMSHDLSKAFDPGKPDFGPDLVQCARYDGHLAHTEVGMTMFYTDLLAKLWFGIDHNGLFPARSLAGISTLARIDVPDTFSDEVTKLVEARLWFGPRSDAISKRTASIGRAYYFDPIAAKVFSAATDPATTLREVPPSEDLRRVFASVNSHYRELADYEPEYHRLNEILKWHAVTEAMAQLAGHPWASLVTYRRTLTTNFFGWLALHQKSLRLAETIAPRVEPLHQTECMDLLRSRWFTLAGVRQQIEGGVTGRVKIPELSSGASEARARQVHAQVDTLAAKPIQVGDRINFVHADIARSRAGGEFRLQTPQVTFGSDARTATIQLGTRRGDVVAVGITVSDDAVTLHVKAGTFERMRRAAGAKSDGEIGDALGRTTRNVVSFDDGTRVFRATNEMPIAVLESSGARADVDYQIAISNKEWLAFRGESATAITRRIGASKAIIIDQTDASTALPVGVELRVTAKRPNIADADRVTISGVGKAHRDLVAEVLPDRVVIPRPDRMAAGEWARVVEELTLTSAKLDAVRATNGGSIAWSELSAPVQSAPDKIRRLLDTVRSSRAAQAKSELRQASTEWTTADRAAAADALVAEGHPAIAAKLGDPGRRDVEFVIDHGVLRGQYRVPGHVSGVAISLDKDRNMVEDATVYIADRARINAAGAEVDIASIIGDPHAGLHYSAIVLDEEQIGIRDDLLVVDDRRYERVEPEHVANWSGAQGRRGGSAGIPAGGRIVLIDLSPGCDDKSQHGADCSQ